VEIEIFPDRPDLLSHETMARAARSFLGGNTVPCALEVTKGTERMVVNPSMGSVRPHVFAAIVRGVDQGSSESQRDRFVQSLMDHQEKLHTTLGRRRRAVSIGVHDLNNVKGPFNVTSDDGSSTFTPLGAEKKMTLVEILESHPKGIEYSHLVDPLAGYPLITDSGSNVISFPPVINGVATTVTTGTTDFLIDVTGWDRRACIAAIRLIALSLSERSGRIESVEVTQYDGSVWSIDMEPVQHLVPTTLVSMILGEDPGDEVVSSSISRMGGNLIGNKNMGSASGGTKWDGENEDEPGYLIEMPSWRFDILHPVDIVEDIAIGLGLDKLATQNSKMNLPGTPLVGASMERRIRQSIRALGVHEVQTLTLTSEARDFNSVRLDARGTVTRIKNPITREHGILRQSVLPSLLSVLAANRHHELPHRIFELGAVVVDHNNSNSVAWACAERNAGFTSAKGYALSLLRDLGTDESDIGLTEGVPGNGPWLAGRVAVVHLRGRKIGSFGEIDPSISSVFGLRVPVHAGEFDVHALTELLPDPLA